MHLPQLYSDCYHVVYYIMFIQRQFTSRPTIPPHLHSPHCVDSPPTLRRNRQKEIAIQDALEWCVVSSASLSPSSPPLVVASMLSSMSSPCRHCRFAPRQCALNCAPMRMVAVECAVIVFATQLPAMCTPTTTHHHNCICISETSTIGTFGANKTASTTSTTS